MAVRIIRLLRQLRDVDTTGVQDGDALVYDDATETWIPGAGGGGVTDHGALTGLADDDHAQYLKEKASGGTATEVPEHTHASAAQGGTISYQPSDSDLTAIAALATTAFGRGLLTLANQAALLAEAGAAAASHAHAGEDITSGTVADARIAATIARDSEVTAAIAAHEAAVDPHPTYTTAAELAAFAQPLDSDLTAIAALTTTAFGRSFLALADAAAARALIDLEPGTDIPSLAVFNDHSARHENGGADEVSVAGLSGLLADGQTPLAHTHAVADVDSEAQLSGKVIKSDGAGGATWEDDETGAGGGAPTDADYLVGTAHGDLSAEIVVGTAPGGELGGTWAAPTVDAVHSGSSHAAVQAAAEATAAAALAAHTGDASDAHDASAISILDAAADFTATEVEGALAELQADAEADATALSDHIADASAAHAASAVSASSATLSGTATDVQGVLEELDNLLDDHSSRHQSGGADEITLTGLSGTPLTLQSHLDDGTDAHDASAISILDAAGDFTAFDVEGALAELQSDHEADAQALADHIADALAAHAASAISVSSTTLSGTGTDVQAVFEEIDNLLDDHSARHENGGADEISLAGLSGTSEALQAHLDDAADAHDASAVSVLDTGTFYTATDVEGVLAEIAPQLGGGGGEEMQRDIAQGSHGLAVGDVVRHNGTIYVKAQANSAANAEVAGIVSAVADAGNFTLHYGGRITGLSGLTAGEVYFLDDDTAGLLTTTEPADAGDVSKPLLIADSTTTGYFFNWRGATIADIAAEFAGQKRVLEVLVTDPNGDALTTGDGKAHVFIPALLNGHNLVAAHAAVTTVSSSGTPTVQIHNVTQAADMLSTLITIDASEKTSYSAAAAPVIDAANDDVATGDELRVDVDVAGTGTKGLVVILTFEAP